ncbi:MAG: hypothetical protein R3316_04405 [Rhodovibrionaceae bacterium]|nr:hypothetical protein [Rhodovibrionaceae bacterium]
MTKKHILRAILLFGLLVSSGAGVAAAGAYEDGWQAYNLRNFERAHEIWRPLAERGDARAQLMVGLLYANGEGVGQDIQEAYMWFLIADANGEPNASSLYEGATRLDELLTPEEKAAAERAARNWRPKAD